MKEHRDDVLLSVKKSSPTVDSTTADEAVTERGKFEGSLGERDGGEDMVVDVVGADVVVDDHGGSRVHLEGKVDLNGSVEEGTERVMKTHDQVMEVGSGVEVVHDAVVESKDLEKVEVVVVSEESVSDCDAQKSGNGTVVGDSKMASEPSMEVSERGVIKEIVEQPTESVLEVADGDHVMDEKTGKEIDVLNSSKIPDSLTTTVNLGSPKGHVESGEEGLVAKDKSEDGVTNQILSATMVDAGTGEDSVHVTDKNLGHQSTTEVTATDVQISGNEIPVSDSKTATELSGEPPLVEGETIIQNESARGLTKETVERPMESVQRVVDVDCVMNEKTIQDEDKDGKDKAQAAIPKDPSSEFPGNPSFSSDRVNAETDVGAVHEKAENLDQKDQAVQRNKEEFSHSTIEDRKSDAKKSGTGNGVGDSKMDDELASKDPQFIKGKDKEDGPERSSTEEIVEQPLSSVQGVADGDCVINEKTAKEDESLTMAGLGSEEVVEGAPGKDKAQVEGSRFQAVDERAIVDEATAAKKAQTSEAQASTAGGIVLETENLAVNVVACTEPESLIDKMVPATTDEVVKIDAGIQTSKVELQTIGDTSKLEGQGLKGDVVNNSVSVNPSNNQLLLTSKTEITAGSPYSGEMRGSEISVQHFDEVNDATTQEDYAENAVLPEGSEFSYEEGHMERGEDAGMDIDEVLGWKDENPGIDASSGRVVCPEKDQNANSEADVGLQEDVKSHQPIVYEHHLKVETQCGNSYEVKVETAHLSSVDETINKDANEHSDKREHTDFCRNQEMEPIDHTMEADQLTFTDDATETLNDETSVLLRQSYYFHSPENEGEFSVSDLVWGKVRSHPWWPGQIFDPSDASDKAMKYHKKDCFLVAYFGDRTFAWNDSSVLKPFRAYFSQIVKHSNSEAFNNAVHCALEEVSRRVELGLTCSCVSQDIYEKIKCQVVDNAGIKQESSIRHGIDKSASVSSFEPDKLLDYVRLLAKFPYGEGDKMELAMAKAQLSSYGRFKGYHKLPEFQFCGNSLEDSSMLGEGVEQVIKDGQQISENNERSLSELTVDATHSGVGAEGIDVNIPSELVSSPGVRAEGIDVNIPSELVSSPGSKKRKALDSFSDGSEKRPSLHTETVTPTAKPSFKIGECIQRVASQLTGPPSVLKSGSDKNTEPTDQLVGVAGSVHSPGHTQPGRLSNEVYPSDMLSQLHLAAQDPMKGYSFLNSIIPFFRSHRASVSKSVRQTSSAGRPTDPRKRKMSNETDPEEFEFDDVNDSYWTDRIIQNFPEEMSLQDNQNGSGENQVVPYEQDKPVKPGRRSNKKRFFSSNHEIEAKEQSELIERRRLNLATEVLMKFAEGIHFPSEIHLNKMFKRFGPLIESETEVDRQSGRARVVFKKCSDAEVAHSSAGKFNIFGSISVNYELNYTPLISYKPLPLPLVQDPTNAS